MASHRIFLLSPSFHEQVKGRWREFRREPSAFFFVLLMPILWMAILGFAFSGHRATVYSVGWQSESDGAGGDARELAHAALKGDPRIKLAEGTTELDGWLKNGTVLLRVTLAEGLVGYEFDPNNREAVAARDVVNSIVQSAAGRHDPLRTADYRIDVPGTRYVDFLVPGLVALSIMTTSLFGTGMTIVVNRRENLLKRYLATPMPPIEFIASHIVGRGMILAVELSVILLAGFAMFRFQVAGTIAAFVAFAALGTAAFAAISLVCASRTNNAATMNGMTNLISLPMMLVSGVWFARTNFPDWMAAIARFLPLSALVDGLRKIALEGAGLASVGYEAVILAVYAVVGTVAAKVLFKWY